MSELPDIIDKNFSGKFLSILVRALNAQRLKPFLDHLQTSCFDARNFEVCVAIDDNSKVEEEILQLKKNYSFEIKIFRTDCSIIKGTIITNDLLFKISDQSTYFVSCVSDRYRFSCKNWDLLIKNYVGVVADDMFFLRMAKYSKNIKTRKTLYHAFTTNENWGIFSRKLLQVTDGFPKELISHDLAFEMLYFFIRNNKKDLLRRDIVMPNILSTDEIVSQTAAGLDSFYKRTLLGLMMVRRSFFKKEILQRLKCRATKVYLTYMLIKRKIDGKVEVDERKKICFIKTSKGKKIRKTSYKISNFFAFKQNLYAKYRSVNFEFFIVAFYPLLRRKWGYDLVLRLIKSRNPFDKFLLFILRMIFGCGDTNFAQHLDNQTMRDALKSSWFQDAYDNGYGKEHWKEIE